jgi:hypothetical protein
VHTTEDSGGRWVAQSSCGLREGSGAAGTMRIISTAEAYSSGGQAPCTLGAGHARALTVGYVKLMQKLISFFD